MVPFGKGVRLYVQDQHGEDHIEIAKDKQFMASVGRSDESFRMRLIALAGWVCFVCEMFSFHLLDELCMK